MDNLEELFNKGQQYLLEASKKGDPILAMKGRALCHRAIELKIGIKKPLG